MYEAEFAKRQNGFLKRKNIASKFVLAESRAGVLNAGDVNEELWPKSDSSVILAHHPEQDYLLLFQQTTEGGWPRTGGGGL